MKNLIELDFDKSGYQNEINRLYEFGKTMTNVQSIIQELTKNEVSVFDLESINQWATQHYNFSNVSAIMELNNLDVKYNYVKGFLIKNSLDYLEQFELTPKGLYVPTEAILDATKERYTTYLKPELVGQYRNLKKIENLLSSVDNRLLQRMLVKTSTKVFIDLKRFSAIQNSFNNIHRL